MYAKKAVTFDGKKYDKGDDFTLSVKDGAKDFDEFVIVPSKVNADFAIVEGKTVTYLAVAEKFEDGWAEYAQTVILEYVKDDNKWDCNAFYAKSAADVVYYLYDGTFYAETADIAKADYIFNVGGVAVAANEAVINVGADLASGTDLADIDFYFNPHTYQFTEVWGKNGAELEEVYCLCDGVKTTFDFVYANKNGAIAEFGQYGWTVAGYYNQLPVYIAKVAPTNYTVVGGGAPVVAPADKDNTVESPKTFDAGIAMYVGMSVMAAAGSAVVLKKKD